MALDNAAGIGVTQVTPTGDQNVDGILNGSKWNSLSLTFSMPSDSSDYTAAEGYSDKAPPDNLAAAPFHDFEKLNTAQSAEVLRAFGLISSYTNLMFAEISETPTSHAAIRLADLSSPPDLVVGRSTKRSTSVGGLILWRLCERSHHRQRSLGSHSP